MQVTGTSLSLYRTVAALMGLLLCAKGGFAQAPLNDPRGPYPTPLVAPPVNPLAILANPPSLPFILHPQTPNPGPAPILPGGEAPPRPARVGEILIEGAQWTKEYVIRRQIPLLPGQILSLPDLRLAERNLARLGIFEVDPQTGVRPTVTVIEPDIDTEFKNILVRVQETHTSSLLFGINVNSDFGLSGGVAFNERNFDITGWPEIDAEGHLRVDDLLNGRAFRGAGQELRVEAMPGTEEQRYTVSFREPFLLDSLFFLAAGAYFQEWAFHHEYTESRLGTRLTLGRPLGSLWRVEETVGIEDVGVHHIPFDAPAQIWRDVGDHLVVGFRSAAVYDDTDSYLRPTSGSHVEFSAEPVTGDYNFVKLLFNGTRYWTTYQRADGSGRHVLAASSDLGYASPNTPVFERFFAGGFRSLRGFAFRGVGPSVAGFEVGGDFLFLNKLEYQLPLLANDHLYGVAFVDSGTVEPSVEIRNYRVSTGVGLRIIVPRLGPVPISLDAGLPLVKGPGDHEEVFSFWVGFYH